MHSFDDLVHECEPSHFSEGFSDPRRDEWLLQGGLEFYFAAEEDFDDFPESKPDECFFYDVLESVVRDNIQDPEPITDEECRLRVEAAGLDRPGIDQILLAIAVALYPDLNSRYVTKEARSNPLLSRALRALAIDPSMMHVADPDLQREVLDVAARLHNPTSEIQRLFIGLSSYGHDRICVNYRNLGIAIRNRENEAIWQDADESATRAISVVYGDAGLQAVLAESIISRPVEKDWDGNPAVYRHGL